MSAINKVLVTGAAGFLGSHVVDTLLDDGYSVRGTARTETAARLLEAYKSFGSTFEVSVIDDIVTSDLSDALKVDSVIHIASPLAGATDAAATIKIDIEGTTHVLKAASAAGVSKVVIMNSIFGLASLPQIATPIVIGENDYHMTTSKEALQPGTDAFFVYAVSKGLADHSAWEYVKDHPELDVAAIYPTFIWGPTRRGQVIDTTTNGNNGLIYALDGPVPATFVHIKGAARAHVNALKLAKSDKPKRIVPNGGEYDWVQAVRHLQRVRPELKDRLPIIEGDGPEIPAAHTTFDNSSARQVGLVEYISFEQTVEEVIDDALRREKALGITPA